MNVAIKETVVKTYSIEGLTFEEITAIKTLLGCVSYNDPFRKITTSLYNKFSSEIPYYSTGG